jgi:phospholipid N-methyltransferase
MWPSSPALARRIVEEAGVREASHVLEIGPGTGVFTGEILNTMTPEAQFLAVEKSPALARDVAARFPAATVREGCATRLAALLKEESFPAPQAVVSGLPWAVFPEVLQRAILEEIGKVVTTGSVFTSFAYFGPHRLPAGRRFRSILGDFFSSVEKTPVIYENFPPAFVYVCRL